MAIDDIMLSSPLSTLKGVGPGLQEKLGKLGLKVVGDLLFHLPLRYQDRTRIYPIGTLRDGMEVVIQGEIEHTDVVFRRRRMMLVRVADGSGAILLRFFHFNEKQRQGLRTGAPIRCFGEARVIAGSPEMVHPEYRVGPSIETEEVEAYLTPIYPATDGVGQTTLRRLVDQALNRVEIVAELLPPELLADNQPELADALRYLHRPPPEAQLELLREGMHPAQQRLAFEELLAHQLSLLKIRAATKKHRALALPPSEKFAKRFMKALPFSLTGAQQRVCNEIAHDLRQAHPMLRLVQGDVGSGKTVVAALACLQAVEAGYQAVIMAPTEILAEQHFSNFTQWFEPLGLTVAWVSGKQKAAERRHMRAQIAEGGAQVAVGTHALFQDDIEFQRLALVIVDEQHRFGVHQRMALREKGAVSGCVPHQLIMTATPIPRTLAQTAYTDLDLSIIDELPPGRKPVTTVALPNDRRADVVERVANACREGQQCYWVCTLVDESDVLQCEAAEVAYGGLREALPDLRIGLVHGRMKPMEKEQVMAKFKSGDLHLLVATTVIEVGVDVPNATLMIIENAERLGLSQLHQLRGRVGRGSGKSSCVLLYQAPLSQTGRRRIKAMRETNDGFEIAQIDLELRGPGEILGVRQTGLMQFRVADLIRDGALIPAVGKAAQRIISQYPEKVDPLIQRWIGDRLQYREV